MGFYRLIKQREVSRELKRMRAWKNAQRVSQLLSLKFPFRKLYLFGSTVKMVKLNRQSDIDLVIEGLPEELFLKAYGFLIRQADFPVDLKPWEILDQQLRKKVRKEGVILYEKK